MLKVKYANGKWATLHRLTHVTPETLDHYISFVKWQLSLKNEIYRDEKSFKEKMRGERKNGNKNLSLSKN